MAQEPPSPTPSLQEVHAHLQAISELLRRPDHLDPAAQTALADLVDELDKALKLGNVPNDEVARLAASASHFAAAVHREEEPGVLRAARDRFEEAVVAAENSAPMVAGLARRFMGALSNIGI